MKKKDAIAADMIEQIKSGRFQLGRNIPSRNRLMLHYHCSRTTIESVIDDLTRAGYLAGKQGSGTVLVSVAPNRPVDEILVAYPFNNSYLEQNHELLLPEQPGDIPRRLLDISRSSTELMSASYSGRAVVWPLPDIEYLREMDILRRKNIPQLLLNRDYDTFDAVCTDVRASIRTGINWLRQMAGDDIAIIGRMPTTMRPYQAERVIAFYEICTDCGITLLPGRAFLEPHDTYYSPASAVKCVQKVFAGTAPRGIFLLNVELAMTLIIWAESQNIILGRDYYLLVFDYRQELSAMQGLAMLRQPYELYRNEFLKWLEYRDGGESRKRFMVKLPAELIIGGQTFA
ncbi:MAG: GntR family transcriptional regulator [Lentisphaerae bacterium]|nr:GntR family transcriptional regulator [Lentisphaerota bacterium]